MQRRPVRRCTCPIPGEPGRGEDGIAMVTVIMMGALIFAMVAGLAIRSVRDIEDVGDERVRERALHVGEAGIENVLNQLVADKTYNTAEVLPASFSSITAERGWAKNLGDTVPAARVMPASGGEWVSIKPLNSSMGDSETVYAVGYVPSREDPQNVRVIRVSYDFAPLAPTAAFLTDGNLSIDGGPALSGLVGSAHANGNVDINGNSVTSTGYIAGSGTFSPASAPSGVQDTANSGGGRPPRFVPTVRPAEWHKFSQYDLCSGPTEIRKGPAFTSPPATFGPCQGDVLAPAGAPSDPAYRGWSFQANNWRYASATNYDGVYYVEGETAIFNGAGSAGNPLRASIISDCGQNESLAHVNHGECDIDLGGNAVMAPYPTMSGILFVAGRDILLSGTAGTTLEGATLAHEHIELAGNTGYSGTLISNSPFNTGGSPVPGNRMGGNATISYSGGFRINLGDNIRITHWQEL